MLVSMTCPGPEVLGRGAVVPLGVESPFPGERVSISGRLLGAPRELAEVVDRLHRAWAERRRVVVELLIGNDVLRSPVVDESEPWELPSDHTVLAERLHFLIWNNNWDMLNGEPVWWWARKAERLGAGRGEKADITLPGGEEAWVDGGPRSAQLGVPTVHSESVLCGRLAVQPGTSPYLPGILADDQRAAAANPSGPVRVIAPAGSGKTRTLGARLLHLVDDRGVEPEIVTAVAYNNRAAKEMRDRRERPDLNIRTIHSLGWAIVRERDPSVKLLSERQVRSLLRRLVPRPPYISNDYLAPYLEGMGEIRIALRDPIEVGTLRGDCDALADVYERYKELLIDRNAVDHDDQVYEAIRILLRDPEARKRWQHRCRHLLVDEFQDLTPAYLLLLRLLASPALNVFGVGDDDQTIYGYAGADPGFLIDFDHLFPGASESALEVNYRCSPEVVEAASALLSHNRHRVDKTIRSASPHRDGDGFRVIPASSREMATATAEVISDWIAGGVEPERIAVLTRVNTSILPVLAALDARDIPFCSHLDASTLKRTLVKSALAWTYMATRPDVIPRDRLVETLRRPSRGIVGVVQPLVPKGGLQARDFSELGEGLPRYHRTRWNEYILDLAVASRVADRSATFDLLEFLYNTIGLARSAKDLDSGRTKVERSTHSDDLVALIRTAAVYGDIPTFEVKLGALMGRCGSESPGVTATSIHRVKGLEWDRVVVFGADSGLIPHRLAENIEEERRVFHVAITRSRRETVVVAEAGNESPFVSEALGEISPTVEPDVLPG